MEQAQTLSQFVSGEDASDKETSSSFHKFLSSVRIVPSDNPYKHGMSSKMKFRKDYNKYIKSLVVELLKTGSDNVLVSGLPKLHTSSFKSVGANSIYTSFMVNELHMYNWKRVFDILGSERMTDLLINWKGFIERDGRLLQIFGDRITYTKTATTDLSKVIRKSSLFHHSQSRPRYWEFTLLKQDLDELMREIFGENTKAKRFKRIRYLVRTIIENDKACKYHLIYRQLLLSGKSINPHKICSNASSFGEVIQFIFVILGKLLSLEAWGGQANKAIIRNRVEEFLKLESLGIMHVHDIQKGLHLNHYQWLGTSPKVTSKQDFEIRKKLLEKYIYWLFSKVVIGVVRSFWYVTQSTDGEMYYFPRHVWHKTSHLWLERYSRDNFVQTVLTGQESYNYGMLKLIPKRNTFRVICAPSKRSPYLLNTKLTPEAQREQDIKFNTYRANVLRPVRLILQTKFNKRSQIDSCYSATASSTQQIANRILNFKSELLQKHSCIPKLYFIKFDMKECYDRMNQKRLIEKVISLFRDDKSDTKYYCRTIGKMRLNLRQQAQKHVASSDLADFDLLSNNQIGNNKSIMVDTGKTVYLTRKEIVDECIQQIFGAKCYIPDRKTQSLKFYRRTQGVFQGFTLSSIFCDILYSAMVAENFRFLWESDSPFFFTRLVDDFLFISPDVEQYNKVLEVISGDRLQKYGAFVNYEKTHLIDYASETTTLDFVGLQIEVDTLSLTTNYSQFGNLSTGNYRTFSDLLRYLKIAYTTRLQEYMLDCARNSFAQVVRNVSNLIEFILGSFNRAFQKTSGTDTFNANNFIKYLWTLITLTLNKFENCNPNSDHLDDMLDNILSTIAETLAHGSQYKEVIRKLRESISEDVAEFATLGA
ncbi:EST2 [Candida theae]|uniref:Telomerase reverse transcriptase n=1 Tax=Candida theae TaxID=1198502 RepID=A0AAD5BE84_9ASCO|nr:EST2 [Candida theae]KAI5957997.1 EST2 [Candida theae]